MSEKKIKEIENMFKQSQKPKLVIEERDELQQLTVILDDTEQGKNALYLALQLAERDKQIKVKIILSEDFHESFDPLINDTIRILSRLDEMADTQAEARNVKISKETLVEQKIQKLIEQYTGASEDDSLNTSLVKKLVQINPDIVVMGIPLFRGVRTDQSIDIGTYASSILRERDIHSSFLLISDKLNDFKDTLLSFVSIEQQAGSIAAVTRRGLSLATKDTKIKIIGIVEDKVIETVARIELADEEQKDDVSEEQLDDEKQEVIEEIIDEQVVDEQEVKKEEDGDKHEQIVDLNAATDKLVAQLDSTMQTLQIAEEIPHKSYNYEIKTGTLSSIVKDCVQENKPGIVLVRSVATDSEHLDAFALQITQLVVNIGYPVLIVWD